ncbi:hypothetical protein [uncultured Celeribacter sp.]|uniref:hypothetical protein n=1 Tax=uncultured Celeribacter sp. TaxID=1303376 RepID=UPI002AA8D351|nr:hypothetical protein [uncultured Celeribacter sp.]
MSATFNNLLLEGGIAPEEVALLRHHTPKRGASAASIADLWRDDPEGFILYQDTQEKNRPILRKRRI